MSLSLSDILLREVSAERSDAVLIRLGAQGLIDVPKSNDIVAHFVLDGEITIEAGDGHTPVTIERGEFALLFYGNRHTIHTDPRPSRTASTTISGWPVGDEPVELKVGPGKEKARLLSAALRLIHNPTSAHGQNPLEDVLRLGGHGGDVFKYEILAIDPEQIEAAAHGPGANAFVNALMNLHLTHAMRCGGMALDSAFKELTRAPYLMSSEKSRAVATAVRLLQTHLEKDWTVASLAREVGQSRSAFAAAFSDCVGMGPMAYLTRARMDRAAALLTERRLDLPLIAIANWVGYEAPSAFARAFKSHFGLSPRAYCKQTRSGALAA